MASRRCRLMLTLAAALLAAACSGGAGAAKTSSAGDAKLSIAYSALKVKVGTSVTLVAHLENTTGAVAWSLSGPGALSADAGDQIVYQALAAGSAKVGAAAAGLTASVSIDVVPGDGGDPAAETVDIMGRVLNQNGYPVQNESVFVVGSAAVPVSTDGDGYFSIAGQTAPYDLAVVEDATNRVYVYTGLTRADPTIYVFTQGDQTNWPARSTLIAGSAFGGDAFPLFDRAAVRFASPEVNQALNFFDEGSLEALPGGYLLGVDWNGPLVTTGTLVGLQIHPDPFTQAPVDYWYASQPDVTIMGNQVLAGPNLTFMPVATANTQGDILLPPLYQLSAKSLALNFEDGVFLPIYLDLVSIAQPNFQYIAPNLGAVSTQVCAAAENTVDSLPGFSISCIDALDPQTDSSTIQILAAPQPFTPANGANAVKANTAFAWSAFAGGVHLVDVYPTDQSNNPEYFIFTAATSTTVPDLGVAGLAFGSGQYGWDVTGFAPYADMDAFAGGIPAAEVFWKTNNPLPVIPPAPCASTGYGQEYAFTH